MLVLKSDLDTPALLIDLDAMEHNIRTMAEYYAPLRARLRPHMKTHKTPIITHQQLEAGAIGVTCQKLEEAEIFARAGIKGILISNQVAGDLKIARLVNLAQWAEVTVGVDDLDNVRAISRAVEKRSKGALDRALSLDRPLIIDTTMPSPLYRTVMLNPPEFAVAMLAAGYPYKGFMTRALQTEREYYNIFDSIYKAWRVPLQYELIPFIPPQKLKRYRDMNAYGHDERTQKRFDRYIQRYEASKKSKK